jgi:hypothetical protein
MASCCPSGAVAIQGACCLYMIHTDLHVCGVTNDQLESQKSSFYDVLLYVVLLWYIPYLNPTISCFARRVVAGSQK